MEKWLTLRGIIKLVHANGDEGYTFSHYMGDFLDYFYQENRSEEERLAMVIDEPNCYGEIEAWCYTYMAAAVHYLCLKYRMRCPKWVFDDKYILPQPYFAMDAKNELKLILLIESPHPFRMRNMYVGSNPLARV